MENELNHSRNIFLSKEIYDKALKEFKISYEFGFLSYFDYDSVELPEFILPYENLVSNLHLLIKESKVQSSINSLDNIRKEQFELIKEEQVFQKIFSISTFLTSAYLFSHKYQENEKVFIPSNLWTMLKYSSDYLQLKPILVLWTNVHLVRRIDKNNEPTFDNIEMKSSFTKTITEKYFLESNYLFEYYLKDFIKETFEINNICWKHVHKIVKSYDDNQNQLESKFKNSQICENLEKNLNDMNISNDQEINKISSENKENDNISDNDYSNFFYKNDLYDELSSEEMIFKYEELTEDEVIKINNAFENLQICQKKVIEFCKLLLIQMDPSVFFNELRLFLRGYSAFENGVGIENSDEILKLTGSSAGQDPMMFLMKFFFGITFTDNFKDYQKGLMNHIRIPHSQFLDYVKNYSIIYKLQHHSKIKENFNISKNLLLDFYKIHKAYVLKFISGPAKQLNLNPDELYGVGDTPINIVKKIHSYFVEAK